MIKKCAVYPYSGLSIAKCISLEHLPARKNDGSANVVAMNDTTMTHMFSKLVSQPRHQPGKTQTYYGGSFRTLLLWVNEICGQPVRNTSRSPRGRLVLIIRTGVSVLIFAGHCSFQEPCIMVSCSLKIAKNHVCHRKIPPGETYEKQTHEQHVFMKISDMNLTTRIKHSNLKRNRFKKTEPHEFLDET